MLTWPALNQSPNQNLPLNRSIEQLHEQDQSSIFARHARHHFITHCIAALFICSLICPLFFLFHLCNLLICFDFNFMQEATKIICIRGLVPNGTVITARKVIPRGAKNGTPPNLPYAGAGDSWERFGGVGGSTSNRACCCVPSKAPNSHHHPVFCCSLVTPDKPPRL